MTEDRDALREPRETLLMVRLDERVPVVRQLAHRIAECCGWLNDDETELHGPVAQFCGRCALDHEAAARLLALLSDPVGRAPEGEADATTERARWLTALIKDFGYVSREKYPNVAALLEEIAGLCRDCGGRFEDHHPSSGHAFTGSFGTAPSPRATPAVPEGASEPKPIGETPFAEWLEPEMEETLLTMDDEGPPKLEAQGCTEATVRRAEHREEHPTLRRASPEQRAQLRQKVRSVPEGERLRELWEVVRLIERARGQVNVCRYNLQTGERLYDGMLAVAFKHASEAGERLRAVLRDRAALTTPTGTAATEGRIIEARDLMMELSRVLNPAVSGYVTIHRTRAADLQRRVASAMVTLDNVRRAGTAEPRAVEGET